MSPIPMSRLEAATRAVLALAEAINQHDSAGLQAVLSAEVRLETSTPAPNGTVIVGRDAVLAFWHKVWQDHPAFRVEIEEVAGLGERCLLRWRLKGCEVPVRQVAVFRVRQGLVAEVLLYGKG